METRVEDASLKAYKETSKWGCSFNSIFETFSADVIPIAESTVHKVSSAGKNRNRKAIAHVNRPMFLENLAHIASLVVESHVCPDRTHEFDFFV